jgi:ribosomal protein S18 acetylase RimI-like enzyme
MQGTQFKPFNIDQLESLMSWFKTEQDVRHWAGPGIRYPFTEASFTEDAGLAQVDSIVMVSPADELLAFGQFYLRFDCCHLARLVVAPTHRRQGLVTQLIDYLSSTGCKQLGVERTSLFVGKQNPSALNVYRALGFTETRYPEPLPIDGHLYLTRRQKNAEGETTSGEDQLQGS